MTIKVKGWSMFQHYKNRRPPWIRLYRDLLDDPDYHALTGDQAKSLILLWLIASEDDTLQGILPNVQKLSFRLRVSEEEMINIIHGLTHWLEFNSDDLLASCYRDASNGLAKRLQDAIPETEAEGDTESDTDTDISDSSHSSESVTNLTLDLNNKSFQGSLLATNVSSLVSSKQKKGRPEAKSTPVWNAYAAAYQERYGVEPKRNQKANIHCCQIVDRLGAEEAPLVAAYYLSSRNAYHVGRGHSLQALVGDCEKIRTEWATGRQITSAKAREEDRLEKMRAGWQHVIDEIGEPD